MITTKFSQLIGEDVFKHQETQTVPYKYYLALSSTPPSPTENSVTEPPASAGYIRAEVDNSEEIFGTSNEQGEVANHTSVYFPESTAEWPTITHFAIYDAPADGEILAYGAFNEPISVLVNTIISVPIGQLKIMFTNI